MCDSHAVPGIGSEGYLCEVVVTVDLSHPDFKTGKVGNSLFVLIKERGIWLCLVKAF